MHQNAGGTFHTITPILVNFRIIISRFTGIANKMRKHKLGSANPSRNRRFSLCLTLDRALDHAFDDVFLRGEVEDHDWQNADDDQRHHSA